MQCSRRTVLKQGGVFIASIPLLPQTAFGKQPPTLFPNGYPSRQELISTAVDAAIAAGATYADARLTHNETLSGSIFPNLRENMAFGVRALYDGYWGFASSPVWSRDEAARLGRDAVAQAKVNVLGRERLTELAPMEITNGHWDMPVKDDPFKMDFEEISDFFKGFATYALTLKYIKVYLWNFQCNRINKAFGSSLGQSITQTLYDSTAQFKFKFSNGGRETGGVIEETSPAGKGFEHFRDQPLREYARIVHEEALHDLTLPLTPVDPGRYSVLMDQSGVSRVLHQSIGTATEIDRVFGFEANSGGTSYITEPDAMLNTLKVGSSTLNVSCDRSQIGSVGRVKWDDEGVMPTKYDIVKDGVLMNLQTNREGASWIKDHYRKTGQQFRSFGSANAPNAMDVQLVHQADLYLKPSDSAFTRDGLRESIEDGIELRLPEVSMDFQQITGWVRGGRAYEIKKGKRVAMLQDVALLFRTSEFWNNVTQVGGQDSIKYYGLSSTKGQPEQSINSGVYAPPATLKEMTVIDVKRKA